MVVLGTKGGTSLVFFWEGMPQIKQRDIGKNTCNNHMVDEKYEPKSNNGKKKAYLCRWCNSGKGEKDAKFKQGVVLYTCTVCVLT